MRKQKNIATKKNAALRFAVLAAVLLFALPASAQDITTGLVGHWKLDELTGTTASDSAGSNDGTMNGGLDAANDTTGAKIMTGLAFDGTDDYIQVGDVLNSLSLPITISGWVYRNDTSNNFLVSTDNANVTAGNRCGSWLEVISDKISAGVGVCGCNHNGCHRTAASTTNVPTGRWVHVAAIYNAYNDRTIYLDGVSQSLTWTGTGTSYAQDGFTFRIGANLRYSNKYTNGNLDDIRVYNRALTAEDIAVLASGTAPGGIRYNDETEAVEYHDGYDWLHAGLGSYSPNAVEFDGTNDGLYLGSDLTGNVDSKKMTGSFWFRRTGSFGGNDVVYQNGSDRIRFRFEGSDRLEFTGMNASATEILNIKPSAAFTDSDWHHIMFSVDMSDTAKRHIYVDGSSDLSITTYTDDILDIAQTAHYVGRNNGAGRLSADLADFWMDFGTYIDLSVAANRAKFYSAGGAPMYLGPDGSLPLKQAPDIFLSGPTEDWHTNKGTGGGFTENGALTDAATQPGSTPPTVVQVSADTASGTSVLMPGVTAGNALVVLLQQGASANRTWSTSDNIEGSWSNDLNFNGASTRDVYAAYFLDHSGGNVTVTTSVDVGGELGSYRVLEVSGVNTFDDSLGWMTYNVETNTDPFIVFSPAIDLPKNSVTFMTMTHNTDTGLHTFTEPGWVEATDTITRLSGYRIDTASTEDITGTVDVPTARYGAAISFALKGVEYCASPTEPQGSILYNTDDKVMQYCNGTDWVAMGPVGGTGGGGCASPAGSAGDIIFNEDYNTLQYCNSEDWVGIGETFRAEPTDGLIAHWKLDETSGSSIADSAGSNTGTWADGANNDVAEETAGGKVGSALYFDHVDDSINVGQVYNTADPVTVTGWMKPGTMLFGQSYSVLSNRVASNDGFSVHVGGAGGSSPNITSRLTFTIQGVADYHTSTNPIQEEQWKHIAVVFTGSEVRFYINGAHLETTATGTMTTGGDMFIGAGGPTGGNPFLGLLDDMRVYDRVLSAKEIYSLYRTTGGL